MRLLAVFLLLCLFFICSCSIEKKENKKEEPPLFQNKKVEKRERVHILYGHNFGPEI